MIGKFFLWNFTSTIMREAKYLFICLIIICTSFAMNVHFSRSAESVCDPMDCSTPGLPVTHHLQDFPKFMSIASVIPSTHLILWHPHSLTLGEIEGRRRQGRPFTYLAHFSYCVIISLQEFYYKELCLLLYMLQTFSSVYRYYWVYEFEILLVFYLHIYQGFSNSKIFF